jgi:hypothetical protein
VGPGGAGVVGRTALSPTRSWARRSACWARLRAVTPNADEACAITGLGPIASVRDAIGVASILRDQRDVEAVLVKGGHWGDDEAIDVLVGARRRGRAGRRRVGRRVAPRHRLRAVDRDRLQPGAGCDARSSMSSSEGVRGGADRGAGATRARSGGGAVKRIVISGATGMIGVPLVRALQSRAATA